MEVVLSFHSLEVVVALSLVYHTVCFFKPLLFVTGRIVVHTVGFVAVRTAGFECIGVVDGVRWTACEWLVEQVATLCLEVVEEPCRSVCQSVEGALWLLMTRSLTCCLLAPVLTRNYVVAVCSSVVEGACFSSSCALKVLCCEQVNHSLSSSGMMC